MRRRLMATKRKPPKPQPCRAYLEKRVAELEAEIDEMRSSLRVFAAHFARIISEKAKLERTIERLREAAKESGTE